MFVPVNVNQSKLSVLVVFIGKEMGPAHPVDSVFLVHHLLGSDLENKCILFQCRLCFIGLLCKPPQDTMSDKSDLKAELERKKQRLAQIREEKKRKEEERKKKEVKKTVHGFMLVFFPIRKGEGG